MQVILIQAYLIGIAGIVVGAAAGFVLVAITNRGRLPRHHAQITAPLLLAAGTAHLFLIPVVELERQVLFGLYFAGVVATVVIGLAGARIWRLGALLLPAGSIAAYFYLAAIVHQADYSGLVIKLIEALAIASAVWPARTIHGRRHSMHVAGG